MKWSLALFLAVPALAVADTKVLISETFDGTSSSANHGRVVAWSSNVKGSLPIVTDPGLAGKAFKGNKIVGILPPIVLSNRGDTVKVSFTFRLAGPIARSTDGFKVGLLEGGDPDHPWYVAPGNGYRWSFATGDSAPVTLVQESGGPDEPILTGQNNNFINQSDGAMALTDTAKHLVVILLQMKDDNLNLSLAIDGKKIMRSNDPLTTSFAPSCFAIRSEANTFFFDDFSVTGNLRPSAPSN